MKSLKLLMMAAILCLPLFNSRAQIEIRTAEDLRSIKNDYTGHYVLMNDIDFTDVTDWLPIGAENIPQGTNDESAVFYGTFDGQNHTLSNIKVNTEGRSFTSALFVKLGSGATVKDLALENVDLTGGNITGGLTGTAFSNSNVMPTAEPILIQNIYVSGNITGHAEVGGITGRCNNDTSITFENCAVDATVTGTDLINPALATHLGLSGGNQGVSQNTNSLVNAGGIVGSAFNGKNIIIKNCLVRGEITAKILYQGISVAATVNPGALIGFVNQADAVVNLQNSVVAVEITGGLNAFFSNSNANIDASTCYVLEDGILDSQTGNFASLATLQTQSFYEGLGWDFDNVWQIQEGEFPIFKWRSYTGLINVEKADKLWKINSSNGRIEFTASEPLLLSVYDITGKTLFVGQVENQVSIPASKGIYILKMNSAGKEAVEKIILK